MCEEEQQHGGIVNYFQGATIHNLVINGNMTKRGTEHYHTAKTTQNGFTDEQVARAIEAICGEGKPLDSKQKWAGVQWLLRWECNYPARAREFCERIASLPLSEDLAYRCEYNNIRPYSTLSFLNDDPRQINNVRYSKNDEGAFLQLREVALALHEELQKTNID